MSSSSYYIETFFKNSIYFRKKKDFTSASLKMFIPRAADWQHQSINCDSKFIVVKVKIFKFYLKEM